MKGRREYIFLDALSTTPVLPQVSKVMTPWQEGVIGLPKSLHRLGRKASKAVEVSREQVAAWIGASSPEEIYFTSGGTEANNMAVQGLALARAQAGSGKRILLSRGEHPSVSETARSLTAQGFSCEFIELEVDGRICLRQLKELLNSQGEDTALLAVHLANHDSGTVQDIKKICSLASKYSIPVAVDASVAGAWVHLNVSELAKSGLATLSLSPHRFFGPRGVGVLYKKKGVEISRIVHGGRQEGGLRAGTENLAAVVGCGKVCELWSKSGALWRQQAGRRQSYFYEHLFQRVFHMAWHGPEPGPLRDPHHMAVSFECVEGEALMLRLDLNSLQLSAVSGCLTRQMKISPVLKAMGVPDELCLGAVMIGILPNMPESHMEQAVQRIEEAVDKIRAVSPRYRRILQDPTKSKLAN